MLFRSALPTGIGAWLSYGVPAPGPIRCALTARRAAGASVVSDLVFVDARGQLFAELRGVETHALPGGVYPTGPRAEA